MSLDGVIDAPTWTFDYGFTPQMEEALGAVTEHCRGILLGRTTYEMSAAGLDVLREPELRPPARDVDKVHRGGAHGPIACRCDRSASEPPPVRTDGARLSC